VAQQTVELNHGQQATYEVLGGGLPALMLPGGPGFGRGYMRGTAELFADVLRSHLIDPHGSGGSTPPADPADYSPEGHARFYEEAREALGLGRVVVFGHSFGATTALTYAALYPEAVERCIAVAPFGVGTEQDEAEGGGATAEMEAMVERHRDAPWYPEAKAAWDSWTERVLATEDPGEVERMMAAVLPLYVAHPERPEVAAALEGFKKDLKADLAADKAWEGGLYQGIDLRPALARVRAPTLVVAGELDPICGPAQARPISEALANARLVLIPDCGHFPSAEAPDRYRAEVVAWLEGTRDQA
jgi:pimeloyl-ACP methyl ester carboxylesterase